MYRFIRPFAGAFAIALLAVAAKADTVTLSFSGTLTSRSYSPGSAITQFYFDNQFPLGIAASSSLTFEYDGDPATAQLTSFTASVAGDTYALTPTATQSFMFADEEPIALIIQDALSIRATGVDGNPPIGLFPTQLVFGVEGQGANLFSSDTPSVPELLNLPDAGLISTLLFFDDLNGDSVGRLTFRPDADGLQVDISNGLPAVPLGASGSMLLIGLSGLAAIMRRIR